MHHISTYLEKHDMKNKTEHNGVIGYEQKIAGYYFRTIELPSGYISFGAPTGNTPEEKRMFDKLVYYNQRIYNGKTEDKQKIMANIRAWIDDYKKPVYCKVCDKSYAFDEVDPCDIPF